MCVQDLKIGEATENYPASFVLSGGPISVLGPDAARIRLIIVIQNSTSFGVGGQDAACTLFSGPTSKLQALCTVNAGSPMAVLRYEDFGSLIQGEIIATGAGTYNPFVYVQSVRLLKSLDQIKREG